MGTRYEYRHRGTWRDAGMSPYEYPRPYPIAASKSEYIGILFGGHVYKYQAKPSGNIIVLTFT